LIRILHNSRRQGYPFNDKDTIIKHDNARPHTAKTQLNFYSEKTSQFYNSQPTALTLICVTGICFQC